MATYSQYVDFFDGFARYMIEKGIYRVLDFSVGDVRMWRFMNDRLFTLVKIQEGANGPASIDIAGAGACEMRPHIELFRFLATPDEQFAFGASFGSIRRDGLAASGIRLWLPLSILDFSTRESMKFTTQMVENLGVIARQKAEALMPTYRGRLFNGEDEDDVANFFAASNGR